MKLKVHPQSILLKCLQTDLFLYYILEALYTTLLSLHLWFHQFLRLIVLRNGLSIIRSQNLQSLRDPRIRDPAQSGHRLQNGRVNQVFFLIKCIFSDPESGPFNDGKYPGLLSWSGGAFTYEFLRALEFSFDGEYGLFHAAALDR